MSSTVYLDIAVESLVYTYEVEVLNDPQLRIELRDGLVEADLVTVELFTDPSNPDLADSFLFFDNPAQVGPRNDAIGDDFSFPARLRWRPSDEAANAQSTTGYDVTARVERQGVSGERMYPGDTTCVWEINVENVAQRLIEERLEQIDFRDPAVIEALQQQTDLHYTVETTIRRSPEPADNTSDEFVDEVVMLRWWDVRGLMEWCLDEVNELASYTIDPLFSVTVDYTRSTDGAEATLFRPDLPVGITYLDDFEIGTALGTENTTLPAWTALDVWRALGDLHGWIVQADHSGWPLRSLQMDVLEAALPDVQDPRTGEVTDPSITQMEWTDDGYDIYHEQAERPDFALKYLNKATREAPYPSRGKYSAATRRINWKGEAYNKNITEVPFRLPRQVALSISDLRFEAPEAPEGYGETIRVFQALLDRQQYGGDVHLAPMFELLNSINEETHIAELYRVPDTPTEQQDGIVCAAFTKQKFASHAIHAASRRVAEGEADLVAWVTSTQTPYVGLPGSYAGRNNTSYSDHIFEVEGMPWVPERVEWNYLRDTVQMRFVWPHRVALDNLRDPDSVSFAPPDAADITATKEQQEYVDEQGRYLRVVWIVRVGVDGALADTWTYQRRTLDDVGDVVLTAPDFPGTRWTEIWEADDVNNPPATPPPAPSEYLDSEDAQVRILDQADGSTTAWSASSAVTDLGTETIILEGQ